MRLNLIKTFGGKGDKRILNWILSKFPPNYRNFTFIDACGGGGSISLNKDPSLRDIWNDIDRATYLVFKYAKSGELKPTTPYRRYLFDLWKMIRLELLKDDLQRAYREFILRNMSRGGMRKSFAWSHRERGGRPGDENAYLNKINNLSKVTARLKNIELYNEDVISLLIRFNSPNSFVYLDPPYLSATRVSKKVYQYEMTHQQHIDLLKFITYEWQGLFLISSYDNKWYDSYLKSYDKIGLEVANHAGQTKKKSNRIEFIWKNY